MTRQIPSAPEPGAPIPAVHPSDSALALLSSRRSAGKLTLDAPGPQPDAVNDLLTVAMRVPDHRRVEPWRFIVFEGDARIQFGTVLAAIYAKKHPEADEEAIARSAARLPMRAPTMVAVISSPNPDHNTPVWEQELSVGAACQNLLLAANAAGWAGVWLTEWIAYDPEVASILGLGPNERVAGYIYLGTAITDPTERRRPEPASKISRWAPQ